MARDGLSDLPKLMARSGSLCEQGAAIIARQVAHREAEEAQRGGMCCDGAAAEDESSQGDMQF
jgi:hypothetical protein